jgi:ATP-dependent exoDNAse (exonuclease V) alpha subunit
METIVGTIIRLIYESQEGDFKVFSLQKKDKSVIRVTGDFPQVLAGAKIELHGAYKSHHKYGMAFKADAHTFAYDKNAESICLYIQSIAKWVGPQRSYQIAEKFGEDLKNIIENNPERLTEIEGIGEKIALSISDAWHLNQNMRDIQIFLHGLGLGIAKIKRIITMFGPDTEQILTENPWKLCSHGFGFTTCDHIAHKLGRNMKDPFRFKQYIIYALHQVSSSGHLFLYPEQLLAAFNKYNSKSDYPFKGGDLIIDDIAPFIRELVNNADLINDKNRIYNLTSFFFENESANLVVKFLNTKSSCKLNPAEADEFIKRYEAQNSIGLTEPFKLSNTQIDAIKSFYTEKVMIMTGGPGTGKTSTTKAFVQILKEKGIRFELMTPTGIAAKKLGNATEGDAYTIHRRLGYKGSTWDCNNMNKYDTDVVIVDEGCLPYKQFVHLSDGTKKYIGDIVNKKLSVEVLSYNFEKQTVESKKVIDWFKYPRKEKKLLRIKLSNTDNREYQRILRCTGNHKIYTPNGEKLASELKVGELVLVRGTFLNSHQKSFLFGTLLGDTHIPKKTKRKRISFVHGQDQKEYLFFKKALYEGNSYETYGGYKKEKKLLCCYTPQIDDLEILYPMFYDNNGKKRITQEWLSNIDEIGLAAWYMDDGYLSNQGGRSYSAILHTEGFKESDCNIIVNWLKQRWDINSSVYKINKKNYFIIRITCKSSIKFWNIIARHTIPSMFYKFPKEYVMECLDYSSLYNTIQGYPILDIEEYEPKGNTHKSVYDICVEDNHNYFSNNVLISNSMVDQEVFYRLISALYASTKIVFVGDNDQLPSVGPGCVLKELIESKIFKTIFLDKIFRQQHCSEIILEAKKIRDGDTDLTYFRSEKEADIWHISDKDEKRIENLIIRFAIQLKTKAKEKDKNRITFQIITPRNEGPLSVFSLNMALQQALNPHNPDNKELKIDSTVIRVGDRIIIKKNNYTHGVFNGDIGKVVQINPLSVLVDIEDFFDTHKRIDLPIREAEEMLKLAYCLTVHKCLPKGTLIYTDIGLIPIEDIKRGNFVLTHKNQFKRVIWSDATGKKPVIRFITKTQSFFESSPTHGFLISSGNYPSFIEANDIKRNDFICISREMCGGADIPISFDGNNTYMGRKVINLPPYIDTEMAWIVGALIGDGCYTDKKDGTVEFSGPSKVELIDNAKKILSTYGLNVIEHDRKGKRHTIYVTSKNFRDFLLSIGLGYTKAREKTIPDIFFKCGVRERASMISGLFDTDGSVSNNGSIRFRTSSRLLAIGVKKILHSLGIISFFKQERPHSYLVSVFGVDSIKFREIITLRHPDKNKILNNYKISHNSKSNHYEIPYGKTIIKSFMDTFKKKEGNSRGIKGKGFFSKYPIECKKCWLILKNKNRCRLPLLLRLKEIAEIESITIPAIMKDCLNDNYYYDKITDIEYAKDLVDMYEIEVDEDHSYCSPSFICHNCQGSEYSIVILPLIKAHGTMLLQRNLLYTAITRAKKKVVLIGQTSAIEQAIMNDKIQKRNTLLAERINQWTTGTGISLHDIFSPSSGSQNKLALNRLLSLEGGSY